MLSSVSQEALCQGPEVTVLVLLDRRVGPMMVEPYVIEEIAHSGKEIHKQVQEQGRQEGSGPNLRIQTMSFFFGGGGAGSKHRCIRTGEALK